MKIKLLLLFCLATLNSFSQSPPWLWAKSAGGASFEIASSVTTDASGNVYVVGGFSSSTITFGTTTLTNIYAPNYYNPDIFIVKYDSIGNILWAKSASGNNADYANSVAIDALGNIYVVGSFLGTTITFESTILTNTGTVNTEDIFVTKYDPSGNLLWAKSAGGNTRDYAFSVSIDSLGSIYVAGSFSNNGITFGSVTLTNTGSYDMFLVKYDTSGNVLWAKSVGGAAYSSCWPNSVTTDASGNVLVAGYFSDSTIIFGSDTLTSTSTGGSLFLAKYDTAGNVLWAKNASGSANSWSWAYSVSADPNGNSYLVGKFGGYEIIFGSDTLTNPVGDNMFITKYDALGNVLWAKISSGTDDNRAYSVATDANGNCYVVGLFTGNSITFGSVTITTVNTNNSPDMVIVKFDATGNLIWAKSPGGVHSYNVGSVAVDVFGNVYVAGDFKPTINFGTATLTSNGNGDMFIAKCAIEFEQIAHTTHTNSTCNGVCNGSATGSVTYGVGPFGYSWAGPSSYTAIGTTITGLCAGSYTLTITDSSNMLPATAITIITQPLVEFNIMTGNDTSFCGGGTATLNVNFIGGSTASCGNSGAMTTIGTGLASNSNSSYPAPFSNWYTSSAQRYLYTVAELNAAGFFAGKIDSIGWNVTNINNISTFHNFTIKMGNTDSTAFHSNDPVSSINYGISPVFYADSVTITTGWNSFHFANSFIWDGVSNIIVQICNNEGPPWPNYSSNAKTTYTNTTYASSQWWLSDNQDQCGFTGGGFSSIANRHPDIRFHYCSAIIDPADYTYLWTPQFGNIANDILQNTTASPLYTTDFIVTVTNNSSGCYRQDTLTVELTSPIANFTMVPDSTNPFNYWAFNTSSGNGLSYSWDFGDGSPLSNSSSSTHIYASANTYTVCLTINSGNCADTLCQNVLVNGTLSPCLALFNISHDTSSSNPNALTVTNLSYGTAITYLWDFGDSATSILPNPSHAYTGIGPYLLCLTVDNGAGCIETYCDSLFGVDSLGRELTQPIVINVIDGPDFGTTGGLEEDIANSIKIWPNPSIGSFQVLSSILKVDCLKIYNVLGKIVFQSEIKNQKAEIDLSKQPNGIYFINIKTEKGTTVQKLIIQK